MHEDFSAVATTAALVYLLGGVFLMHWVVSRMQMRSSGSRRSRSFWLDRLSWSWPSP
jgi:hypothetical protein